MLYDFPSTLTSLSELGIYIANTVPVFWMATLGGILLIAILSSLRFGLIKSLLSSFTLHFILSVLFYVLHWIGKEYMLGASILLGLSVIYAWFNKK